MKTVYNSLTFYDTIEKQERNRFNQTVPIHSPRHQLPPFIIMANGDAITGVDTVEIYDKAGNRGFIDFPDTEFDTSLPGGKKWDNGVTGFATFTSGGLEIFSAIGSNPAYAETKIDNLIAGQIVKMSGLFTLNSGTRVILYWKLYSNGGVLLDSANETWTASGLKAKSYTCIAGGYLSIYLQNPDVANVNFSFTGVGFATDILTKDFQSIPAIYTDAVLGKYIEYKGAVLLNPLPYGEWYLKISVDGYVYYSDYFVVSDIYTKMMGSWTNSSYETLVSSGSKILSAIETGTSGVCLGETFNVKNGETIKVIFTLNLNSGQAPVVHLANSGWTISDSEVSASGINALSLTATWKGSASIILYNTAAANWSTSEILVIRDYSPNFCKIKYYDAANLGELLYADSFYQEVWLEAILNHTSHETVQVGEEKDGIFIPEKITTKLNYSIVAYICHALYLALVRLPQHSSITITDEVGNTYSPQPGNISIEQPEWVDYNTVKAVIKFNNDSTSNFSWVKT